jgi:hypothetical protein
MTVYTEWLRKFHRATHFRGCLLSDKAWSSSGYYRTRCQFVPFTFPVFSGCDVTLFSMLGAICITLLYLMFLILEFLMRNSCNTHERQDL